MLKNLKAMFGLGPSTDFKELTENGALILDVRSPMEFNGGHIKGSKNYPLDSLNNRMKSLKNKEQVIITCCASGMRSASAKSVLKSNGFTNVHNGGGWSSLQRKI
jgi:rhodanese-related sulfurtransferase